MSELQAPASLPPVTADEPLRAGVGEGSSPHDFTGITPPRRRGGAARFITDVIIELGFVAKEKVEAAVEQGRATGKSPEDVLVESGALGTDQLARATAERFGLDHVDLTVYKPDIAAVNLLGATSAKRYHAIPIGFHSSGNLLVAMADPSNVFALDDIRTITGRDVQPLVATSNDVEQAIAKFSNMGEQVEALATEVVEAMEQDADLIDVEAAIEDAPIVKLVQAIMTQAVGDRASDVHIEPNERDVRVRFRVDGVLHEVMHSPRSIQGA